MDLKNKIVLLTGASTGIGKAVARALLERRAKVIVFGLHKPEFCSLFYRVDVSKEPQIISALSGIKKIDILINNAGIVKDARIEKTSNQMLDAMIDVNFKGTFWMTKHSIPKLNRNGCIINMGSLCGLRGFAGIGVYAATKAAVISLAETLAQELADRGIRVNSIAPGVVDTEIWKKRFGAEGIKVRKEIERHTLLKRCSSPEEIAHAVIFLCENNFIDGETILLDGGQNLE